MPASRNFVLMDGALIIREVQFVNEGKVGFSDLLIKNGRIEKIQEDISAPFRALEINASGKYLLPGMIDDQVHFREPGLTHKADIESESRAAAAGGITSFMEMPNTVPPALSLELLEEKYARAQTVSAVNYSFYLGTSPDNLEQIKRINPTQVCGLKIFMGSSTGNLLVDNPVYLEEVFKSAPCLIATHCEHEPTVRADMERLRKEFPIADARIHPQARSAEACYLSSSFAVDLAQKTGARLHILHISTERELALFEAGGDLSKKQITAEACIHHIWFSEEDYERLGNAIKWNPSVKRLADRNALREAIRMGKIDVLATDHAPHTLEEKEKTYWDAPSGGPLVQHALPALLELVCEGVFTLPEVVSKTAHAPALCFGVQDRGFIREGYKADLVLVDMNQEQKVSKENILYKCGWSPFEGQVFHSRIEKTWVNGNLVWSEGKINPAVRGERLSFSRR